MDLRLVVKEIVGQVVADVAKDASAKNVDSHIPVPVENKMCETIERGC